MELAKSDICDGAWECAREQLQTLLATENPLYRAAFELNDKPEAQRLLAQVANNQDRVRRTSRTATVEFAAVRHGGTRCGGVGRSCRA